MTLAQDFEPFGGKTHVTDIAATPWFATAGLQPQAIACLGQTASMEQSDRHNPLRYIDPTGHRYCEAGLADPQLCDGNNALDIEEDRGI